MQRHAAGLKRWCVVTTSPALVVLVNWIVSTPDSSTEYDVPKSCVVSFSNLMTAH
jgi:hypothetical protein